MKKSKKQEIKSILKSYKKLKKEVKKFKKRATALPLEHSFNLNYADLFLESEKVLFGLELFVDETAFFVKTSDVKSQKDLIERIKKSFVKERYKLPSSTSLFECLSSTVINDFEMDLTNLCKLDEDV